jgi:hypothetical protein
LPGQYFIKKKQKWKWKKHYYHKHKYQIHNIIKKLYRYLNMINIK